MFIRAQAWNHLLILGVILGKFLGLLDPHFSNYKQGVIDFLSCREGWTR